MNTRVTIPTKVMASVVWRIEPSERVGDPFLIPTPDVTIITDASLIVRGAHMDKHIAQGTWSLRMPGCISAY